VAGLADHHLGTGLLANSYQYCGDKLSVSRRRNHAPLGVILPTGFRLRISSVFSAGNPCVRAQQAGRGRDPGPEFFLGWTAIGWVIALVWALKQDVPVVIR